MDVHSLYSARQLERKRGDKPLDSVIRVAKAAAKADEPINVEIKAKAKAKAKETQNAQAVMEATLAAAAAEASSRSCSRSRRGAKARRARRARAEASETRGAGYGPNLQCGACARAGLESDTAPRGLDSDAFGRNGAGGAARSYLPPVC